jgi:hypothetical protein
MAYAMIKIKYLPDHFTLFYTCLYVHVVRKTAPLLCRMLYAEIKGIW